MKISSEVGEIECIKRALDDFQIVNLQEDNFQSKILEFTENKVNSLDEMTEVDKGNVKF